MSEWLGFYSTAQVSRLARIPLRTLYDWRERGIITPAVVIQNEQGQAEDTGFSYAQLTILKIMRALRDNQLDLKHMSIALQHLFDRLSQSNQYGSRDQEVTDVELFDLLDGSNRSNIDRSQAVPGVDFEPCTGSLDRDLTDDLELELRLRKVCLGVAVRIDLETLDRRRSLLG